MADSPDRDLERLFALDTAPGPARPVDDATRATIIDRALAGAGFSPPGGGGGGSDGGASSVASRGAVRGIATTKLAVLAGGAVVAIAAVAWLAWRGPHEPPAASAPATVRADLPTPGSAAPASPGSAARPAIDHAAEATRPAADRAAVTDRAAAVTAPATDHAAALDHAIGKATRAPSHPAGSPGGSHRKPRAAPAVAAVAAAPDDLLAEANAARAARRWRDADALYARVVKGPHTELAGQTALVASGALHLEHLGDPAGAARRFRAALKAASRSTLAEDARWGLVEAARALGDATGELAALDDFLAQHAGSPLAPRARARRVELGASR